MLNSGFISNSIVDVNDVAVTVPTSYWSTTDRQVPSECPVSQAWELAVEEAKHTAISDSWNTAKKRSVAPIILHLMCF